MTFSPDGRQLPETYRMTALRGPEEVYNRYIDSLGYDDDGDPNAVAMFAFALVEKDKFDWMTHRRKENNGDSPAEIDVNRWYQDRPESYFQEKERIAVNWYMGFARTLLKDEIEQAKKDAIRDCIGDKLGFWSQLWVSLACNTAFAVMVALIAVYIFVDFSPIAWVKSHFQ